MCWEHKINHQLRKGWICLRIKSQTRWTSPSNPRNWKPWMMFWQPSMKKLERKRSFGTKRRTSVTWWQRMLTRGRGSKRRKASRRRRNSSFKGRRAM
nr:unknown [Zea mays]